MQKIVQTLVVCLLLTGCTTTAKLGTTATGAVIGAAVAGPVGAVGGAVAGDLVSEVIVDPIMSIKEKKEVVEQKVESVWGLLAKLGESAAWVIAGVLIIPLVLGYLIPSPHRRKE